MSHMVFLNFSIDLFLENRHMLHTVILNFTKIQEHCISPKNRHISHMVFLNFSIDLFLENRHMSHMVFLNFTKIRSIASLYKPPHVTYGVLEF